MPRLLQETIHATTNATTGDLASWYDQITGLYLGSGYDPVDFNDHLIREYNRRAYNIGATGQMITPYDAGFRYLGTGAF